jgi:hypothetical protein
MKRIFTKSLIAALCVVATTSSSAQTKNFRLKEVSMNSFISGNSFGVQRNPAAGFLIGKRVEISAGPTFNRGFCKNTGGLLSMRYYFVRDNESYNGHLRLSSVVTLQRMHNQSLNKEAQLLEQRMAFNMKNDELARFDEMKYSGWEAAAGISCAYQCYYGMVIRAEASLCYFGTQKQTHKEIHSFHEENGTSLRLGFTVGWTIKGKPNAPAAVNAPL